MKNHLLIIKTIIFYLLFTALAAEGAVSPGIEWEPEAEPFDLYFSAEPLVEVTSRYPKALPKIAENVTVITAAEIEAANVHTLAELLNRVAGMFVSFNGQDFGSSASLLIHGGSSSSHNHHTLVLLDGVKQNHIDGGTAETNNLPLAIIERIEVVRGPASSAWGSALGGVINIITRDAGRTAIPQGKVFSSYGEGDSSDLRTEVKGGGGPFGYYLQGDRLNSDGLRDDRYFKRESAYGKFRFELPRNSELQLTSGYAEPEQKFFDSSAMGISFTGELRDWFNTVAYSVNLADSLALSINANHFTRDLKQSITVLKTGPLGSAGDLLQASINQEDSFGAEVRLVWSTKGNTLAFGLDYNRNELGQRIISGLPSVTVAAPAAEERWAIYLNDTISYGKLTIIPGLRYDGHSISEDFFSPSLGLVYQHRPETIFRASVARGFSSPFLAMINGDSSFFSATNPDLEPEKVWSYQAGLETASLGPWRLKATIFFHDLDNLWGQDSGGKLINVGKNERYGYELELDTAPFHNLSLTANLTSIYEETENPATTENDHMYNVNLILAYDRPNRFRAELYGHYGWLLDKGWELYNGSFNDFLWDFSLSRKFTTGDRQIKLFGKVHNIFNSSQYWWDQVPNPGRWVEIGASFAF